MTNDKVTNQLSTFLEQYIKFTRSNIDDDSKEIEIFNSTLLVNRHFDNNTPISDFKNFVRNNRYQNKFTGIVLCDFQESQITKIICNIHKYQGIYQTAINISKSEDNDTNKTSIINSDLTTLHSQNENNIIYIAFPNPVKAFEFLINN